ncbi:MAG: amidohydrolase family protein [Alphaproteobacteria bacterium]|nr:amidohydrolase family protein [Alphaproteobacteria bacterium]
MAAAILTQARKSGVRMMVGSEAGFSTTPYGEWHARELELYVTYLGFAPIEAINAATGFNAEMLGLNETGSIAPGKLADILVVAGDVSKNIRLLQDKSKFRSLLHGGHPVDLTTPVPEARRWPSERVNSWATQRITRDAVGAA